MHRLRRTSCTTGSILAIFLVAVPLAAQAPAACPREGACVDVAAFSAVVTDFRTSLIDRSTRQLTATVRFTNRTMQPLILGYVSGSGISLDDQGNKYVVYGSTAVRGIGEITSNNFDTKFTLRPGESSDARLEFTFQPSSRDQIIGTAWDLDLAIRQIDPLAGNQYRLGKEHSLHFRGFGREGVAANGPRTAPAPALAPPAAGGVPSEADQCRGRPRCFGAGTFVAEVVQIIASNESRHHVLRSTIRVRNMAAQPIILAYKATTSGITDNLGNHYYWGRAGTYDMSVSGIGKVEGSRVDPQFQLAPGESREIRFSTIRYDAARLEHGTVFTEELSLVLLEPLPSGQVRVGREFAVSFRDIAVGAGDAARQAGTSAAQRILDAMRKPKKP